MNRKLSTSQLHLQLLFFPAVGLTLCAILVSLNGCGNAIRRGQSPDDSFTKFNEKESGTRFIGHVCGVRGLRPARIEGIGLVVGLEGTGSDPAPSGQKDYLIKELKSNKTTENAKSAIASRNTSMVMLRGLIPPAAKKGDRIDIEVITHPKTDSTSLKYGDLLQTDLRPMAFLSRSVKLGNVMGKAKGKVLVDDLFDNRTDDQNLLRGRILGGGVVGEDRKLTLVVHSEETSVKITRSIAHSINGRFTTYTSSGRDNTAKPVTDRIIELNIPKAYQYNLGRFIQALQAMAYAESVDDRVDRIDDLDRRISDPATSQRAAIELEAIGEEGIPALLRALKHPDFEVRFHIAEALAYLGKTDGIPHLKLAAESEPAFRWHALTALASIENKSANNALFDLFDVQSAETRYGAFHALQACSPNEKRIAGRKLGNEFHFHNIPSKGPGLVHFARTTRPEIVVFGETDRVADDFIFVEAGLTVKAIDKKRVRITRFDPIDGESRLICSSRITELIKTLSKFRVGYTTLLEMCREANSSGTLNSRLVINAAPRIGSKSMQDSVSQQGQEERSEKYIANPVPELFSGVQVDGTDKETNAD